MNNNHRHTRCKQELISSMAMGRISVTPGAARPLIQIELGPVNTNLVAASNLADLLRLMIE